MYSGKKDWVEDYFDTIESNDHSQAELKRFAGPTSWGIGILCRTEAGRAMWNAVLKAM